MDKLIRPKELSKALGISIPTLFRIMKEPDFPDKIRISKQAIGFRESDIIEWMEKRQTPSNVSKNPKLASDANRK